MIRARPGRGRGAAFQETCRKSLWVFYIEGRRAALFLGSGRSRKGKRMAYDVCIVGAGPVGGALACRLAVAGLRVAAIDRAALPPMEHPDFDGRAYAIAAGSRRLLEEAGLWDAL